METREYRFVGGVADGQVRNLSKHAKYISVPCPRLWETPHKDDVENEMLYIPHNGILWLATIFRNMERLGYSPWMFASDD